MLGDGDANLNTLPFYQRSILGALAFANRSDLQYLLRAHRTLDTSLGCPVTPLRVDGIQLLSKTFRVIYGLLGVDKATASPCARVGYEEHTKTNIRQRRKAG